ncbi:oxidoreductase-like domain-containing protein [Cupriavidus basilensis]
MPDPSLQDDPRPAPPERPGDNECCGSGCDPCIFDYYYQELERYRDELEGLGSTRGCPSGGGRGFPT